MSGIKRITFLLASFLLLGVLCLPPTSAESKPSVGEGYQELLKEYQQAREKASKAYREAKTEEAKREAMALYPNQEKFATKFLQIAKLEGNNPTGFEAAKWVIQNATYSPSAKEAIKLLEKHHLSSPDLHEALSSLTYATAPEAEQLLRSAREKGADRKTKGIATYTLAKVLHNQQGNKSTSQESERLLEEVMRDGKGIQIYNRDLTRMAERDLFEIRNLAIGKPAPEIEGEDADGKKFKLSDYRGKVVVLDFWGDW